MVGTGSILVSTDWSVYVHSCAVAARSPLNTGRDVTCTCFIRVIRLHATHYIAYQLIVICDADSDELSRSLRVIRIWYCPLWSVYCIVCRCWGGTPGFQTYRCCTESQHV